jgi:DNA primase
MISPQTIQQITNRIDIIDVVGEFVKLKKRGANYLGNCPFHNEKTPSFTVSPSKEIFKCFGCGKSGNSIGFLMEHEKYSYVEALRWLAQRYNIEIEETIVSNEVKEQQQAAESLFIINNFAQQFFTDQLLNSEEGQSHALTYLEERGFSRSIIEKFQLGYSPQFRTAFTETALAKQFNKELLLKTGLIAERNGELVDNYRGRIIFPIHNTSGKILGFGARVIGKADKAPKYINTPENEIYVKSKILYGTYFARHTIDKKDECLLVEGYTDVTSLNQAGIENVVASGGTSLTTDQLRLIRKYTNNLTIIYDGDAAGIKAALRGLDMALEEGLNVKVVLIPDNEDPDSYVNKVGTTAFIDFIAATKKDFVLFQLEVMLKEAGNDISKKNDVVNSIAESLSKISKAEDFSKQQEYIRQASAILKIDESGLTNLVNKYKRDRFAKDEKKLPFEENNAEATVVPEPEFVNADEPYEKNVLRVLLEYGLKPWDEKQTIAEHIFEELEQFNFELPDMERLFEEYRQQYTAGYEPTAKSLLYHEDKKFRELVVSVTMFPYELSQRWDDVMENMNILNRDVSHQDVSLSLNYFKMRKIKKMLDLNQQDLQDDSKTYEQKKELIQIHLHLKEIEKELRSELGTVIFK